MSVLVPSFPSSNTSHPHYFSTNLINGNLSQSTKHMSLTNRLTSKLNSDIDNDQVPFGVVNSMKQRLLDKVNESLLLNNNSTLIRHSLIKSSSSRILSNENLLQTKSLISPLKRTTRLSRSQDNLSNNNTEQFTSYLQPKQDVIIVDTTTSNDENISIHRHSYTELHVDEVPKPGTVTTVKNMFERQIRLSRFDSDKLSSTSIPATSRVHREILSPNRSRSISPNDMALRQRRTAAIHASTTLSGPAPASYPDLVISHTPPISSHIELNKISNEQSILNTQNENKKKDIPLNTTIDEISIMNSDSNRPNLLLPSTSSSDIDNYQPLDFKSRLALFNHTNTIERSNEHTQISTNIKKPSNPPAPPSFLTKPTLHHHVDKKDIPSDQVARSLINTTKTVTFFGGTKVNGNTKSTVSESIPPPLPSIINEEQLSISTAIDLFHAPDVIGGNVKLNKSSIFSGMKKDARVQFTDNIDTYEYPSFNLTMTELGGTASDDNDEDDDDSSTNDDETNTKANHTNENINNHIGDVDDDELERLARTNAKFNSNNLAEKPLQPKGTLHTFRPTHLDQYELGTQHSSLTNPNSSDIFSRENNFTNQSIFKQDISTFDMSNNIQWSSMSTTTDLLF